MPRTRASVRSPEPAFADDNCIPPPAPPAQDSDDPAPSCTCDHARGEGCSFCCTVVIATPRDEDCDNCEDAGPPEDPEEDEDESPRRRPAKKAAKRAPAKKAARIESPNVTIEDIHRTQTNLIESLARIFRDACPRTQDYVNVVVPYLAQFVRNRIADGLYPLFSKPIDLTLLKRSPHHPNKYMTRLTNSRSWHYNSNLYHRNLFGTDCLPSWSSTLAIEECRYRDNVELWTTLLLFSYMMTSDSVNAYHDTKIPKGVRFGEWDLGDYHTDKLYTYQSEPEDAPSSAPAPAPSRHDDEDEEDEECYDEEEDDEGESNKKVTLDFMTHDGRLNFTSGLSTKFLAMNRYCSILPFVFWKNDIVSEDSVHVAMNRYQPVSKTKYIKSSSDYQAFLIGNCLVEGYHFNVNSELKGIIPTEADVDGVIDAFEADAIESDVFDNEFSDTRNLATYTIAEDFVKRIDSAQPVVRVERFYLSPSIALSLCGLHNRLNPAATTMEEALRLAAEKELTVVASERKKALEAVIDARRELARVTTQLANQDMRYVALTSALKGNLEEALRRLEPLNLEKIEITPQGSVLMQTGPIIGKFVNAKYAGQKFYVGNFQIIMSILSPSFILRNIAAPIIATPGGSTYAELKSLIHPHSNTGGTICWGGYSSELKMHHMSSEMPIADDFETRVRTLLMFLTTANGDDPYVSKWMNALKPEIPGVTMPSDWDASMSTGRVTTPGRKQYGVTPKSIAKSEVTNAFVRTVTMNGRHERRVRLETEEGIVWTS